MFSLLEPGPEAKTAESRDRTVHPAPAARDSSDLPDASLLHDKTPLWFRTSPSSAALVLILGAVFLVLASRPLWHTDLWDHLNYGQFILDQRQIPQFEPLLQLAQGMPMVNIPWLAQIGMTLLHNHIGLSALQFAYALLVVGSMGIIVRTAVRRTGNAIAGLIAGSVFLTLNYHQFLVIRPQLAGVLFFCVVVAWAQENQQRVHRAAWYLPLMFTLWANCHGSFAVGLLLMVLTAAGRFLDVLGCSGSLRLAIRDPQTLRMLVLIQFCAIAALLNPYGLWIYAEVLRVTGSPNVESMFEWNPLTLRMSQGRWAAAVTLLTLTALKLTPRRLRFTELLPLIVTGLLALWSARMINWWAPLMAVVTAVHLTAWLKSLSWPGFRKEPMRTSGLWTVVSIGLCWILFSLTNLGIQLVHGRVAEPARMVSRQTPLLLATFLHAEEKIPAGVSFVPAEWAGYLMHAGPESLAPMVNLHVHLIPEEVWNDYLRLLQGSGDWGTILDQYGINLVIVDRDQQPGLLRRLADSDHWSMRYRDHQSMVFSRNKPI